MAFTAFDKTHILTIPLTQRSSAKKTVGRSRNFESDIKILITDIRGRMTQAKMVAPKRMV
jgi:hypothetical protein